MVEGDGGGARGRGEGGRGRAPGPEPRVRVRGPGSGPGARAPGPGPGIPRTHTDPMRAPHAKDLHPTSSRARGPGLGAKHPSLPEQIGFSICVDYFPFEAGFGISGNRFQKPCRPDFVSRGRL